MLVDSCIPVMRSADLEKSLRFLVDGPGLSIATDDDGYSPSFGVATNKSG